MSEIAFQIGNITIGWYGIMISLGVLGALTTAYYECKRRGENPDHIINIALIIVPLGVIGARLYHVIDKWSYYSQNLPEIFGGQGLGIFGGIVGGVIGLYIYSRWKQVSMLRWLDIFGPGLMLAQAVGRWGNFFNQELYGYPTDLPWGIFIDESHRLAGFEEYTHFHPMFLYESLWNFVGFGLLMILGRKLRDRLKDGDIFLLYLIHYGIGRFILEGFKIDVWTLGGIPTARWITGIAVIAAIGLFIYRHYRKTKRPNNEENNEI